MNKQPVYYFQTDPRWKDKPYQAPGETATIGGSGCGPSCAAMLIETLTGQTYTPEDACNWSMANGHKAPNQGTYYSYFTPQFAAFGIDCQQMNWTSLYGKPSDSKHIEALELLKEGYYLIACMGPGLWTSSGHFVVVWWEDGKVRINDPASTRQERQNGDLDTFKSQVKYYFWVDARSYNNKEETDMTGEQIYNALNEYLNEQAVPDWAKAEFQEAVDMDISDGSSPMQLISRYQAAIMAKRAAPAAAGMNFVIKLEGGLWLGTSDILAAGGVYPGGTSQEAGVSDISESFPGATGLFVDFLHQRFYRFVNGVPVPLEIGDGSGVYLAYS